MTKKTFLIFVLFLIWGCSQEGEVEVSTSKQEEVLLNNRHNPKNNKKRQIGIAERTVAHTTHALFDVTAYMQKVERAVSFYRDSIRKRPKDRKLILVLGGSSTGGMSHQNQHFWPSHLQKKMSNYHVQSLALGGATTWHISKILQKLGVKAEYCILYSGHNDRMQSSPRQSLAQLEKGTQPQSSGFTPWVLPSELPTYLDIMANHCDEIFAMEEYVVSDAEPLDDFIRALKAHPKINYIPIAEEISKIDNGKIMRDNIHFQPYGHQIFAEILYEKLKNFGL